jgi:hypothetical protein
MMMLLVLAGFQNPSAQDSLAQQTIAHLARVGYSIAQEQWIVTDSGRSAVILTLRPALAHLTALMVGAIQVEPVIVLGTRSCYFMIPPYNCTYCFFDNNPGYCDGGETAPCPH